jgi:hypothetical protein
MEQLRDIWRRAWRPPDRRSPWAWAEEHIEGISYSPVPGRFRSEHSPWIREPLETLVDPRVRILSIIAPIQSGKTSIGEIGLSYIIANMPGPTLWLDQTDEDAKDQAESRLHKLFEECPPVRSLFPGDRHKKRTTTIHFANGMTLWVLGAHNKTNLQRRSIRWLIGDETWRWPVGHMAEAEARVTAFGWLGKCLFLSQGGEEGDDTHRKFETTDMREWTFACPHCGTRQPFRWENVEWSKDARMESGGWNYGRVRETASLHCEHCQTYFPDTDRVRRELNATGRYVPQNPTASNENAGFHWNALCAMSWGRLAELYLRAKELARQGDTTQIQQFYQKRLALPWKEWVEDFRIEVSSGAYRLGEPWEREGALDPHGKVLEPPFADGLPRVPLRFLTVDVQRDHFFLAVRSWAPDCSSRLLWCERVLSWNDIDSVQDRFNVHHNLVFIDAGYNPYEVYRECAARGWTALIGDKRATFTHKLANGQSVQRFYSPVRKVFIGRGVICRTHFWSNLNIKDTLARLRRNAEPKSGATWEVPEDVPELYLEHLESERRVNQNGKWLWEQIGSRPNHWLDCESMQVAAAYMVKLIGADLPGESGEEPASGDVEIGETVR